MGYYGYYSDSDYDISHYGVKGMKWGVRKARDTFRKAVRKSVERRVNARDFSNDAVMRRGQAKAGYELLKSSYESGKSNMSHKTYRKKAKEYRKDIRRAKRDIREMNNAWILPVEKEHYMKAGPKGKVALKALHDVQGAATQAGVAYGLAYGVNKARRNYKEKKLRKYYGLDQ